MGQRNEFSREEKIAAVKLVTEGGRSCLSVANEYGIHENTLRKWKNLYRINPEGAFTGTPAADTEAAGEDRELAQLRRRVKELEAENDFLKKSRRTLRKARGKVCHHPEKRGNRERRQGLSADARTATGLLCVSGAYGQSGRAPGSNAAGED